MASGKPISVYRKTRLDTHKLVEEYMLLANRAVAEFIFKSQNDPAPHKATQDKGKQSVYRIHGKPDPERIEALATFLKALGFDLRNVDGTVTSRDINKLLKDAAIIMQLRAGEAPYQTYSDGSTCRLAAADM